MLGFPRCCCLNERRELALSHLFAGCLLCLTIIGIPLGVGAFKMAGAALVPFGKEIVRLRDFHEPPAGSVLVRAAHNRPAAQSNVVRVDAVHAAQLASPR